MKTCHFSLLLIATFIFASCKKEKVNSFNNAEFTFTTFKKDGPLLLYKNKGERVEDLSTVTDLLELSTRFFNEDGQSQIVDKIKFKSKDSLYFLGKDQSPFDRFAYRIDGNAIYLYKTIYIQKNRGELFSLSERIVKYKPEISDISSIPGQGNVVGFQKVTTISIGQISQNEIKLNQFRFVLQQDYTSYTLPIFRGILSNQFDEEFPKDLTFFQLMAVQPFVLNFTRSN